MRRHVSAVLTGFIVVSLLSSCGLTEHPMDPGAGSDEDTASIVLALTTVPSDVQCLEVSVTGAGSKTQLFTVTPGMATTVVVQGLATGTVSITERAFAVACAQVTTTTTPTWVSVMPATATLVPGQITDVTIVLRRPGQVRITNDFQDGQFIASEGALAFGDVVVGTTSPRINFTITNGGTTTATIPALTIAGSHAAQFVVQAPGGAANPCTATTSLAAGASCTTGVRFAPTSTGAKSATFVIGSISAVSLSGTGLAPPLMPSVTSLAFGTVGVGSGLTLTFTITNTGTVALTLPTFQASGADATQFIVQTPGGATPPCTSGTSLAAGATCTAGVRFAPTSVGTKVATMIVGSSSVSLTGTAVTAASLLIPSVTSLMFGNVILGNGSTMNITITNTGTGAVTLPTLQAGGADATQFIVIPGGTNPCMSGASLAAGAVCTTGVRFAPTSTGLKAASMLVGTTSISLRGTGI